MEAIIIRHNFNPKKFKWLYAKYAWGVNPTQHCTNAIRGKYSKRFNRNNPDFASGEPIILDEYPDLGWDAIYICGVSTKGYKDHANYPHNVHIAVIPEPGHADAWEFEGWKMSLENGRFEYVAGEDALPAELQRFPPEYITCRMFRWAVTHYKDQIEVYKKIEYRRR